MTIARVGFDAEANIFVITGQGVYPAGAVVVSYEGDKVLLKTVAGHVEIDKPWRDVVRLDGSAFESREQQEAWLTAEAARQPFGGNTDFRALYLLARS